MVSTGKNVRIRLSVGCVSQDPTMSENVRTVGLLQDFVYLGAGGRWCLVHWSIPESFTEVCSIWIVVDLAEHVLQGTQSAGQGWVLVDRRALPNRLLYQLTSKYRVGVGCSIVDFDRSSLICQDPGRRGCTVATW